MTLEELFTLEEEIPCPGCPVCQPRLPRHRRSTSQANRQSTVAGSALSTPAESVRPAADRLALSVPAGRSLR